MIRLLATGLLTLIILSGCEQKEPPAPQAQIQCSDYNKLTDENAKKELEKRCPALKRNFTPSTSNKGLLAE